MRSPPPNLGDGHSSEPGFSAGPQGRGAVLSGSRARGGGRTAGSKTLGVRGSGRARAPGEGAPGHLRGAGWWGRWDLGEPLSPPPSGFC